MAVLEGPDQVELRLGAEGFAGGNPDEPATRTDNVRRRLRDSLQVRITTCCVLRSQSASVSLSCF